MRVSVSETVRGVTITAAELRARSQANPVVKPRQASRWRVIGGAPASAAAVPAVPDWPGTAGWQPIGPDLPQPVADKIIGPNFVDSSYVPPDTMGAVGPTDFLFTENGIFRGVLKYPPHTAVLTTTDAAFWSGVADPAGVSDPHVRYDRATGRWFITEIDVRLNDNHILLAVSSSADLSTAAWTRYAIPATGPSVDNNCFADYDTPGIDQNAIYIGANMFGGNFGVCPGSDYLHSNLYVVQKASALSGTAHVTAFSAVASGVAAIETIQGVDSFDSLPTGYAVAVDEATSPRTHLNLWQIHNSGTLTPTLTGPVTVTISAENGTLGGVLSANNAASSDSSRPMDDLDDRLFAAVIRDGHLWTAHNVAVDHTGNANASSPDRDAVRWYDLDLAGPSLHQSGTVFDGSTSAPFLSYWMGTIMPSGQGHVALGLNRADISTTVQAGAVGRLAGDPPGTMLGFTLVQTSTSDAYDDFTSNPANRWGDYTYTSLDPCDDMTLWTTQEYVAGSLLGNDWGVVAGKLQAPPPAALASVGPKGVLLGQNSLSVVVTGTSASGSGFYNTPSTLTDPCRKTITATVSNGVTVNSISYIDPTHLQLNLSTVAAIAGTATVTVTNPDGQSAAGAVLSVLFKLELPLIVR
jgi:hypothetical protein